MTANSRWSCRVDGCTEPTPAVLFYKRTRICPFHSQQPLILVSGKSVRFCALCKRLQPVDDFDGEKKSCRNALADHNRRRRKRRSQDAARADGGEPVLSEDGFGGAWSPYARSPHARCSPDSQQHKRAAGVAAAEHRWSQHDQQQHVQRGPVLPTPALVPVQLQHQQSNTTHLAPSPTELQADTGHAGRAAGFLVELARMLSINSAAQQAAGGPGCASSGGGCPPPGAPTSASQSASSGASEGSLQQQHQHQEQQARLRALLEQAQRQQPQQAQHQLQGPPLLTPAPALEGDSSAALAAALAAAVAAASISPYPSPAAEGGRERAELAAPRGEESLYAGSSARSSLEAMPLASLRGAEVPAQAWPSGPGPEVSEVLPAHRMLRELSTVLSSGELQGSLPGWHGPNQPAPSCSLPAEVSEVLQALLTALSIQPTGAAQAPAHAAAQHAGPPLLMPALQSGALLQPVAGPPALPPALSEALAGRGARSGLQPAPALLGPQGAALQPCMQQREQQQPEMLSALALLSEVALSLSLPAAAPALDAPLGNSQYQQACHPLSPHALPPPGVVQRRGHGDTAPASTLQGIPGSIQRDLVQHLGQALAAAAAPGTAAPAAAAAVPGPAAATVEADAALLQSLQQWGGSPGHLFTGGAQLQQQHQQQPAETLHFPTWQLPAGRGAPLPSGTAALVAAVADALAAALTQRTAISAPAAGPAALAGAATQTGSFHGVESKLRDLLHHLQR